MIVRLYQKTTTTAFLLAQYSLQKLGYTTYLADERSGLIRTQKKSAALGQIFFFDVRISSNKNTVSMLLVSNIFSESTCNFIADALSEELFVETLHDLLRIPPPDNPYSLSNEDYAFAAGY